MDFWENSTNQTLNNAQLSYKRGFLVCVTMIGQFFYIPKNKLCLKIMS